MTNEKLEQCLAQALEKTAPHDVDGVLSRCEKRKGTEIPMKTKPHSLKKWMAMAACLALLLLCGGGLFLRQANAVASVVSIDVNPSIELRVNQNEKVLACVPMNDDAHAILADMGDGAVELFVVHVQPGKMPGVGVIAKTDIDGIRAFAHRRFKRRQIPCRADQLHG